MAKERREFAAMVRGDHADDKAFREYVLAQLRCAHFRARLYVKEIAMIGIALRGGVVDAETAVQMLRDANALDFLTELPDDESQKAAAEFEKTPS
jgi:hypothetical protein